MIITQPFAMCRYEVTFAEYDAFCEATGRQKPDDSGWGRGDRPVIYVSWNDAVAYTEWLTQKTGQKYRLPTEAESEYAARAGTTTAYWWGDRISPQQANYLDSDIRKTEPVNRYTPNPWGLYQVHGNVWEWCSDGYGDYPTGTVRDPTGAATGGARVYRGGSWDVLARGVRAAYRYAPAPGFRFDYLGFRCARVQVVSQTGW